MSTRRPLPSCPINNTEKKQSERRVLPNPPKNDSCPSIIHSKPSNSISSLKKPPARSLESLHTKSVQQSTEPQLPPKPSLLQLESITNKKQNENIPSIPTKRTPIVSPRNVQKIDSSMYKPLPIIPKPPPKIPSLTQKPPPPQKPASLQSGIQSAIEKVEKKKKKKKRNKHTSHFSGGTLRLFSKKYDTNSPELTPSKPERTLNSTNDSGNFKANTQLIAAAISKRSSVQVSPRDRITADSALPIKLNSESTKPTTVNTSSDKIVKVDSSFSKPRVARVEFGRENTSKAINITTRTSPVEAFEGLMNKISKGLPPERRDTLVAKYAKYTLYRQFEDGSLEQIYSDEPLLSPVQLVGTNSMPKFLFTDQKVDAKTRDDDVGTINLGSMMQETHLKEEKKADNAIDEILLTERKFLFDTDLIIEMVLKPIINNDIIPAKTRDQMFLNIQQINSFHRELYRRFQIDNSAKGIVNVFDDEIISYLEIVYTTFLGYYEHALQVFYSTRDHSEKFRKFLSKLSAESPVFKDKSLNNLLVTPMQRCCKYELLLRNVISQEKKKSNPDLQSIKELKRIMTELNITLQRIDKHRVESDDWEQILRLEEKLGLSEPLRKRGRLIIAEGSFNTSRRLLNGSVLSRMCSVILFNDILLRTYKSSKSFQYKVLDISPLFHLFIVDPQQVYSSVPNSIIVCNIAPRGAILELVLPSIEERRDWYGYLVKYTIPLNKVIEEWNLPTSVGGVIYAVDNCTWKEAFIDRCRISITKQCIILIWESFGMTQTEIIPYSSITDIQSIKNSGDKIKTNSWKEDYNLTKFNNYSSTSKILRTVWQTYKRDHKSESNITIKRTLSINKVSSIWKTKLSLHDEDILQIWNKSTSVAYNESKTILPGDFLNDKLYMVTKGTVIQTGIGCEIKVLSTGELFGIISFLDDTKTESTKIIAGQNGATVVNVKRDDIMKLFESKPLVIAKLFASLANILIERSK